MNNYLQKMERNLILGYVQNIFFSLYFMAPIWFAFETQYVSPVTLGIIYAVSHVITVILELPTGALADLIGRRSTMLMGIILSAVSFALMGGARSALWLWWGYGLYGVANSLVSGAETALFYDTLKELGREHLFAKISAKRSLIFRLGLTFASLTGGFIYIFNQRLPYFLMAGSLLIGSVIVYFSTEPKIDSEKFTLTNYIKQTKDGVKQLLKNNYIKDFAGYYIMVAGITWYFIYYLNNAFITQISFSEVERSLLMGGVNLAMTLANLWVVHQKWLTRKMAYVMFPVLMVMGFLPAIFVSKLFAIPIVFISCWVATMRWSVLDQYSNQEFESKYRATALSTMNMGVSIVAVVLFIVGGWVTQRFGSAFMMSGLGILTLLTVVPLTNVLVKNHS